MGVSTQYMVMTPWEQELIVFEQNVVVGDRSEVGDEVVVHFSPRHAFGLDGSASRSEGVDPVVLALEAMNQSLISDAPEA
jgi:spermidine/putrescine transport system ATP-binding protein